MQVTENNEVIVPKSLEEQKTDLMERKALPIGVTEFNNWADRIIAGAGLPATRESQEMVLAERLMHIGPVEAFKEDAYFMNALRVAAVKQVAHARFVEIQKAKKKRLAEVTAQEQQQKGVTDEPVLADKGVQDASKDVATGT